MDEDDRVEKFPLPSSIHTPLSGEGTSLNLRLLGEEMTINHPDKSRVKKRELYPISCEKGT